MLFVPVSGPHGSGELMRCLIIARELRRADPTIESHFLVSRNAVFREAVEFPVHDCDDSPTRSTPQVLATIDAGATVRGRVRQCRAHRAAACREELGRATRVFEPLAAPALESIPRHVAATARRALDRVPEIRDGRAEPARAPQAAVVAELRRAAPRHAVHAVRSGGAPARGCGGRGWTRKVRGLHARRTWRAARCEAWTRRSCSWPRPR